MIEFNYEISFKLADENRIRSWIKSCLEHYNCEVGEINYIFCNDDYLHKLNVEFLQHDTLTDIISFDYSLGSLINGDIYISVERVTENANEYMQTFDNELNRVIIHGVLHYVGFKDKTLKDKELMTIEEDICLNLLVNT